MPGRRQHRRVGSRAASHLIRHTLADLRTTLDQDREPAVTLVLALAAAFMYGSGVALQHREATLMPDAASVHFGLLLRLVRRPMWLLGVGADFVGFTLQAAALSHGALVIV